MGRNGETWALLRQDPVPCDLRRAAAVTTCFRRVFGPDNETTGAQTSVASRWPECFNPPLRPGLSDLSRSFAPATSIGFGTSSNVSTYPRIHVPWYPWPRAPPRAWAPLSPAIKQGCGSYHT